MSSPDVSTDCMAAFYRQRMERLEKQVATVSAQCHAAQSALQRERSEHASTVSSMQETFKTNLADMQQRQAAVEEQGPLLQQQVSDAKQQLRDVLISDAAYKELLAVPEAKRCLGDAVRVCLHEHLLQLKQDNEMLRLSAQVRSLFCRTELSSTTIMRLHVCAR